MNLQRIDNWTSTEDEILAKTILEYVRYGKTQLQAFEDVGEKIDRSESACQYRWNAVLRNNYKEELRLARRERRHQKLDMPKLEKPVLLPNNQTITVDDLSIKEFNGLRVVTLKDIDELHGRTDGTASRNFLSNKDRFIEGEDYFFVKTQNNEFRGLESIPNRGVTVFTESGYLMLVKSFTDDLAWEVQRKLIKTYFRAKQQNQMLMPQTYEEALEHLLISVKKEKEAQKQIEVLSPKAERYEDLMNAENCQDMNQVAKAFKTGRNRLFSYLREQKVMLSDKPLPYQTYIDKGYFIVIEVEKNNLAHTKTLVTPLGIDFIAKLLRENPPKQGFFDRVKSLFTKQSPLLPTTDN